jgi:hypothetical protein
MAEVNKPYTYQLKKSSVISTNNNEKFISKSKSKEKSQRYFFQPTLRISQPNDVFEQEADAMANKVMSTSASTYQPSLDSGVLIQRKCTDCEEENNMQRKESNNTSVLTTTSTVQQSLQSGGEPMDDSTRTFMEQQFNHDFSQVRIHNDSTAHQSSNDINARAYTHEQDIVFAAGQYQPATHEGKKLLAHELTHVIQQQKMGESMIHRSVSDASACSRTTDPSAPPQPLMFVGLSDTFAGTSVDFAIMMLKMDMMTSTGVPSGKAFDAYRSRFGDPVESKGKFKNRFSGSVHASLADAQVSEMRSLIGILEQVEKFLDRDIVYRCLGNATPIVAGCQFKKCQPGDVLRTCKGIKAIGICPDFWSLLPAEREIGIIHEVFHIHFGFGDIDKAPFAQTFNQRRHEPECFASFVADVNNVTPFDPSCPST